MASHAQDKSKNGKQPISTHPAFPFIVGLWFAALLGLGSLVVPVGLVEQLVLATGLSSLIPQTAPPLGFTARALIALGFTLFGAISGLVIAKRIARAHMPQLDDDTRQPISAHEELGEDGIGTATPRGRRALAIEPEAGPSEFLEIAPLPGVTEAPQSYDFAEFEDAEEQEQPAEVMELVELVEDTPEALETSEVDALELTESSAEYGHPEMAEIEEPVAVAEAPAQVFISEPAMETAPAVPEPTLEPELLPSLEDMQVFQPEAEAIDGAWPEEQLEDFNEETPAITPAPEPEPADEPLAFSPPSLARDETPEDTEQMIEDTAGHQNFQPFDDAETSDVDAPQDLPEETFAEAPSSQDTDTAQESDLDDMGLVQLAQRLGASIEKRRAQRQAKAELAASTIASTAPQLIAGAFEAAEADEAAEAKAAFFGSAADNAPEAPPADAETPELAADEEPVPDVTDEQDNDSLDRQVFQPVEDAHEEPAQHFQPLGGFMSIPSDDLDEEEDEELSGLAASFTLPILRQTAQAGNDVQAGSNSASADFSPSDAPLGDSDMEAQLQADEHREEGEEESEEEGEGYGSLTALKSPFPSQPEEFVRIEDEPEAEEGSVEPAVVFPADSANSYMAQETATPVAPIVPAADSRAFDPPAANQAAAETTPLPPLPTPLDTEENDRALREALLNLQRMSKAG